MCRAIFRVWNTCCGIAPGPLRARATLRDPRPRRPHRQSPLCAAQAQSGQLGRPGPRPKDQSARGGSSIGRAVLILYRQRITCGRKSGPIKRKRCRPRRESVAANRLHSTAKFAGDEHAREQVAVYGLVEPGPNPGISLRTFSKLRQNVGVWKATPRLSNRACRSPASSARSRGVAGVNRHVQAGSASIHEAANHSLAGERFTRSEA
jgi:hypothetical protein